MSAPLGWGSPGCDAAELRQIVNPGMVDDSPYFPLRVHYLVAPLFVELVDWLVDARAAADLPPLTCSGGYHKRRIAGTLIWSNHSWGLAADFCARTNPMSLRLRTDMPVGTAAKAAELGMRWGGTYRGRKDPMHFEFIGTPAHALELSRALLDPPPLPPSGEDGYDMPPTIRRGSTGRAVKMLQVLLAGLHGHTIGTDGDFGPGTEAAVKRHQQAHKLGADGIVGPATWRTVIR